jgi:UDP-glucose 4-epimerase
MRALVVGGAGFVGSHVVDRLLAERHHVDVVDDLSTGSLANLAAARATHTHAVKIHNVDVRLPELGELLARQQPEVVIHLGLGKSVGAPRTAVEQRLLGSVNLLEAAVRAKAAKVVVVVPAGQLYGEVATRDLPVKEGALGPARSLATVTARTVCDLLGVYRERWALEFTVLAVASVYGPRQRPVDGVVAAFVRAAARGASCTIHGDGRQTRDFLFVDDAVDAIVRATERGSGLVVNVGTGKQTSVRDLHALVTDGDEPPATFAPARPDEPGRFAVSPVRARIHLSWAPWTTLAEGIAATKAAPAAH